MKVKISHLEKLARRALRFYGYKGKELKIILGVLMYAQLRGNNQGVVKLIGRGLPKNSQAKEITVDKQTKLSVLLNGNNNNGMVVLTKAMNFAVKKAKSHGIGIAGTNNTNTSTGAIGFFANEIAKLGYIGFVFAGSPETVAMHGSFEPIFGTNPIAIGVPTTNDPIVLDMATAAMAYYGLIEAKTAGRSIPADIAYDSEGHLTSDPTKAMDGALKSFDKNYKGAGLSMIVEILTGPLVRASFTGVGDTAQNWGNLILVLDPELLTDREEFKRQVTQLAQRVKNTKMLSGVREIRVPGERGNALTKEHRESGEIEIEDNLLKQLKNVGRSN